MSFITEVLYIILNDIKYRTKYDYNEDFTESLINDSYFISFFENIWNKKLFYMGYQVSIMGYHVLSGYNYYITVVLYGKIIEPDNMSEGSTKCHMHHM